MQALFESPERSGGRLPLAHCERAPSLRGAKGTVGKIRKKNRAQSASEGRLIYDRW